MPEPENSDRKMAPKIVKCVDDFEAATSRHDIGIKTTETPPNRKQELDISLNN